MSLIDMRGTALEAVGLHHLDVTGRARYRKRYRDEHG